MYSEESKSSNLAKFLSVYDYVFVDTCSLMEDSFPIFMDTLAASKEYWKDGLRVIVIGECVQELEKHSKSKEKEAVEARIEAKRALKILHHDKWHGKTLEITKVTTKDGFADHALFTQVSSLRIQNKILIITQDKTLTTDLKKLNALDSQHGRFLAVYRLNQAGDLEENPGESGLPYHRENARPSVSNDSKYDNNRQGHGFFHHDHPQTIVEEKPVVAPLTKPEEVESPVAAADRRLCANLLNPNYSVDKKIADISSQLTLLSGLKPEEISKLSLAYTVEQLKAELTRFGGKPVVVSKPSEPVKPAEAIVKPLEPARIVEAPKPVVSIAKPMPVQPVKPLERPFVPEAPRPHYWFEFGRTPDEAIRAVGVHEGLMFRDPSIPFFKGVHGPVDLTTDDLTKLSAQIGILKTGESKELPLASFVVHVEKTEKDYKAYLIKPQLKPLEATKPVEAPKPVEVAKPLEPTRPTETVKPVEVKPAAVASEPKPVVRHTRGRKPASAPTAAPASSTSVSTPNSTTAVPQGANLIVGVPNDNAKAYIERKSRREDSQTLSIVKEDGSKGPDTIVPLPKKSPSASPKRVPRKTETVKKPVAPSKKVEQAKKPAQPKAAKPASPKRDAKLTGLALTDKNLNAKINNPNYPVDSKIKDLKAQEVLVKSLSPEQQAKLFFPASKIAAKIAELTKK